MEPEVQPNSLRPKEQVYAIKTWHYLRLGMVVLVAGLGVSIAFERGKVSPGCWPESISAYYYTPVQGFFVGALLAIGVCLFCLKGSTEIEDLFLNLAGMLAPIVALVPTPDKGSCFSVAAPKQERAANIANNMTALLATELLALLILAVLARRGSHSRGSRIGYVAAVFVWIAALLVFWRDRDLFDSSAHDVAAVLMFVCILVVVCINARGFKEKTGAKSPRNRYAAIAILMILSAIAAGIAKWRGWDYSIIAVEAAFIILFAVFWVIQTRELRREGLR